MSLKDSLQMLQYIDTLLKYNNFTKAAKNLYISQPYLTQTIKKVEQELGVEIINRQSAHFKLTEAGKIYYQYLETLEAKEADLQKRIARFSRSAQPRIRLGILASLGTFLLPLFVPKFLIKHQNTRLNIEEDLPQINEKRVIEETLDFFIGQNADTISQELTVHRCGFEHYYIIIPKTSTFYQENEFILPAKSIKLKELLQENLVLTTNGSAIRRQIDQLLNNYKMKPKILLESSNIYTVAALAKNGSGIAVVPESVLFPFEQGAYNLYPISKEFLSLDYFIAYSSNRILSEVEKDFIHGFLNSNKRRHRY
ncbi:LysR family transcriptional regulator [Tetragenococcus halophilus]|nr:LysR family transcriptional regulator [Tetragenococcus halophilus]